MICEISGYNDSPDDMSEQGFPIHLVYFRMIIVNLINCFFSLNRSLFTFFRKFSVVTGDVRCRILCRKTCTVDFEEQAKMYV